MAPADIGGLVDVGDPRVAPGGRQVAYVVTTVDLPGNRYLSRVWEAETDGSSPPRPVTAEGERCLHPRWSPDGSRLAVVTVAEDDEERAPDDPACIVSVLEVAGGTDPAPRTEVLRWRDDIADVEWSPDGQTLACVARVR